MYFLSDALNEPDDDVLIDEGAFLVLPSGSLIFIKNL